MVFATLKNEGIDTSGMSTDEAVNKYNELQKKTGGKAGADQPTPAENRRVGADKTELSNRTIGNKETKAKVEKTPEFKRNINFEDNQEIDWDLAEKNEKTNGSRAKNPNRHDKWGNELLSDEAFNVGLEAGKSYLDYVTKYNDLSTLKRSNVFLGGLDETITNAITNNGFNPKNDTTYQDKNEIIGNLLGEEVDMEKYGIDATKGFTGKKYIGYKPK